MYVHILKVFTNKKQKKNLTGLQIKKEFFFKYLYIFSFFKNSYTYLYFERKNIKKESCSIVQCF